MTERFDNFLDYVKIFLYNLQRVIFWSRYILLYLIGGIIALDQMRLIMYYHNIFMLISLAVALLLTLILLPKITSSNYRTLQTKLRIDIKKSRLKALANLVVQYISDVTVGFTLISHMLTFYCPQIAIMLLRIYSPIILLGIALLFCIVGIFNYHSYNQKVAINSILAECKNQTPADEREFNKGYFIASIVLGLVVFFGLNKYFFGIALIFYMYSPPTLLAAAIFILGGIFAKFGWSRSCWQVIQATAMAIGTSYTTMLLGKILYLSFCSSMLVSGSATNTIIIALPGIPYTPILMLFSLVLGVYYGFSFYQDLVEEYDTICFLESTEPKVLTSTFFSSHMDLSSKSIMLMELAMTSSGADIEHSMVDSDEEGAAPQKD